MLRRKQTAGPESYTYTLAVRSSCSDILQFSFESDISTELTGTNQWVELRWSSDAAQFEFREAANDEQTNVWFSITELTEPMIKSVALAVEQVCDAIWIMNMRQLLVEGSFAYSVNRQVRAELMAATTSAEFFRLFRQFQAGDYPIREVYVEPMAKQQVNLGRDIPLPDIPEMVRYN